MIIHNLLFKDKLISPNFIKRFTNLFLSQNNNSRCVYSILEGYNYLKFNNHCFINNSRTFSTTNLDNSHVENTNNKENSVVKTGDFNSLDLNLRQLCRVSHQNFLVYAYNHFDFDTIIKINNQVLAPYQTYHRKKTEDHRRKYLQKFQKCIAKHKPESDHEMLAGLLIRCIDLLTSHDMYSMLRVRYILNYDNSFETLRSSRGIDTLEKFTNVQKAKEIRDKVLEEKASKNKTAKRNLLMRYLKINKLKFFRDQNITKTVYEASIDWNDENINKTEMEESRFAFIYNLPYIEIEYLKDGLMKLLSKFGKVKNMEIIKDRVPPLTSYQRPNLNSKKLTYQPKDKYSPLHAIVEFESKEERNELCSTNLRVFGMLFFGRLIYPELAEYKHSLITALYPPFKRMTGALQYIANTLVDANDEYNDEDQSHEFSTCKITPFTRRKKKHGTQLVVTAEKHGKNASTEEDTNKQIRDNHIDSSMIEDIKKDTLADLEPQWIVLRFNNFKHAYYARQKLVEHLKYEPRSFVSFDTKRSVFHNGKYMDLPLFRYNQDNETDITYTNLSRMNQEVE